MRQVKPRKPRGIKLNGQRSMDLCPYCYSFGCNPMSMSHAFSEKIRKRLDNGQCPSCGKPKAFCSCKSSLNLHTGEIRLCTHNNRKMRNLMAQNARKEHV